MTTESEILPIDDSKLDNSTIWIYRWVLTMDNLVVCGGIKDFIENNVW